MKNDKEKDNDNNNDIDFGYSTAIAGFAPALLLVVVMFATSGRV